MSARDEIRAVVHEAINALSAGDAARLRQALSERADAVHIGTDPGRMVDQHGRVRKAAAGFPRQPLVTVGGARRVPGDSDLVPMKVAYRRDVTARSCP